MNIPSLIDDCLEADTYGEILVSLRRLADSLKLPTKGISTYRYGSFTEVWHAGFGNGGPVLTLHRGEGSSEAKCTYLASLIEASANK